MESSKNVIKFFLGNINSENYKDNVNELNVYKEVGCNMSLKIHFLDSHLEDRQIRLLLLLPFLRGETRVNETRILQLMRDVS